MMKILRSHCFVKDPAGLVRNAELHPGQTTISEYTFYLENDFLLAIHFHLNKVFVLFCQ
jgi:hypothetical protein